MVRIGGGHPDRRRCAPLLGCACVHSRLLLSIMCVRDVQSDLKLTKAQLLQLLHAAKRSARDTMVSVCMHTCVCLKRLHSGATWFTHWHQLFAAVWLCVPCLCLLRTHTVHIATEAIPCPPRDRDAAGRGDGAGERGARSSVRELESRCTHGPRVCRRSRCCGTWRQRRSRLALRLTRRCAWRGTADIVGAL